MKVNNILKSCIQNAELSGESRTEISKSCLIGMLDFVNEQQATIDKLKSERLELAEAVLGGCEVFDERDNTVSCLYCDAESPLWLAHDSDCVVNIAEKILLERAEESINHEI